MEVPVINRINDHSLLSRPLTVSGVGKLRHIASFLKGALLLLVFLVPFTTLVTKVKCLLLRLRKADVSLPSTTLLYDYDSDTDSSCSSSDSASDDEDDDEDKEGDSVRGYGYERNDDKGIIGNIPWIRRCSGSFGDLLSWPDLGGLGSSGVVKLWDHLDINGEGSRHRNAMASFFGGCVVASSSLSPDVLLAAEKKRNDAVEVSAWDAREGFGMPTLLAEWRQPAGRLLGKIVRVWDGDVDKIYVGDELDGEITVGDMRMVNGALTESEVVTVVRRRLPF